MAYFRNIWQPEEIITAAKLNRMEDGIEDSYLRAERNIEEIIHGGELEDLLKNLINTYMVSIDQQNNKLIFKFRNTNN